MYDTFIIGNRCHNSSGFCQKADVSAQWYHENHRKSYQRAKFQYRYEAYSKFGVVEKDSDSRFWIGDRNNAESSRVCHQTVHFVRYRPNGPDALRLGKLPQAWRKY